MIRMAKINSDAMKLWALDFLLPWCDNVDLFSDQELVLPTLPVAELLQQIYKHFTTVMIQSKNNIPNQVISIWQRLSQATTKNHKIIVNYLLHKAIESKTHFNICRILIGNLYRYESDQSQTSSDPSVASKTMEHLLFPITFNGVYYFVASQPPEFDLLNGSDANEFSEENKLRKVIIQISGDLIDILLPEIHLLLIWCFFMYNNHNEQNVIAEFFITLLDYLQQSLLKLITPNQSGVNTENTLLAALSTARWSPQLPTTPQNMESTTLEGLESNNIPVRQLRSEPMESSGNIPVSRGRSLAQPQILTNAQQILLNNEVISSENSIASSYDPLKKRGIPTNKVLVQQQSSPSLLAPATRARSNQRTSLHSTAGTRITPKAVECDENEENESNEEEEEEEYEENEEEEQSNEEEEEHRENQESKTEEKAGRKINKEEIKKIVKKLEKLKENFKVEKRMNMKWKSDHYKEGRIMEKTEEQKEHKRTDIDRVTTEQVVEVLCECFKALELENIIIKWSDETLHWLTVFPDAKFKLLGIEIYGYLQKYVIQIRKLKENETNQVIVCLLSMIDKYQHLLEKYIQNATTVMNLMNDYDISYFSLIVPTCRGIIIELIHCLSIFIPSLIQECQYSILLKIYWCLISILRMSNPSFLQIIQSSLHLLYCFFSNSIFSILPSSIYKTQLFTLENQFQWYFKGVLPFILHFLYSPSLERISFIFLSNIFITLSSLSPPSSTSSPSPPSFCDLAPPSTPCTSNSLDIYLYPQPDFIPHIVLISLFPWFHSKLFTTLYRSNSLVCIFLPFSFFLPFSPFSPSFPLPSPFLPSPFFLPFSPSFLPSSFFLPFSPSFLFPSLSLPSPFLFLLSLVPSNHLSCFTD